ncbi:hypothetical protein C6X96_05975 [Bacillus pumilus]|uniref:hypothetical protein n=1 Tax=Bacillus pumilus TaxID=1408 RepID=UPI000D02D586|nr:hypothetical protein [Bacillus pumilus]PRS33890.1 hypothetical protein C6X96_05975 [Bacillus pumilus]
MIFIIGIITAFMIAILGFTVFVDVGNGWGTALSIIGGLVILIIAGRCQRRKEQNDPNILLDKMMMLFHEDGFQASTYIFSEQVDKGFAIDDVAESDDQEEVSTLELRFTMNDQVSSTTTINFLCFDVPVRKSNVQYLSERENLQEIYHDIDAMIG